MKNRVLVSLVFFMAGLGVASEHDDDGWSPVSERSMSSKNQEPAAVTEVCEKVTLLEVHAGRQQEGGKSPKSRHARSKSTVGLGLEPSEEA